MTTLSWRAMEALLMTRQQLGERGEEVASLQAGLAQWGADLDALTQQPEFASLDWDGRVLRMVRRGLDTPAEGLRVVAWTRRSDDGQGQGQGQGLRWQSGPLTTHVELAPAWHEAAQWAQHASDKDRHHEVRIVLLDQWQIFYHRGDGWRSPLSSIGEGATPEVSRTPKLPDAIRLVLTLSPGQALSRRVTRDWLNPGQSVSATGQRRFNLL